MIDVSIFANNNCIILYSQLKVFCCSFSVLVAVAVPKDKLMCLGKLTATHWALWPRGSGHYPLNLPNKV